MVIPRWLKALAAGFVVFIMAAIAFAVFEPIQVLPRMRLAPGYSLVDQDGNQFTSETVRGSIVLYSFGGNECGDECDDVNETMARVGEHVRDEIDFGDVDFRLVSIVLDPQATTVASASPPRLLADTPAVTWDRVTSDSSTLSTVVGAGFRRYFDASDPDEIRYDPGFIIVDGNGVVRGDYRYQTLANEADKLTRHLEILASELRHADGPAGAAYEAAHLFLCYP